MQRKLLRDAGWQGYHSSFTGSSRLFSWHGLCNGQTQHKRFLMVSSPSASVSQRFFPSGVAPLCGFHLRPSSQLYGRRTTAQCHYTTMSRTRLRYIAVEMTRCVEPKNASTKGLVDKPKEARLEPLPSGIVTKDEGNNALLNSNTLHGKVLRLRRWLMDGINHYWEGSKLLGQNTQNAMGLLPKLTKGQDLSRREKAELINAATDLFRLVPFAVFVIVPFMEFLLPLALRLFPNMLPSTFQDKLKQEEDKKQQLKSKLTMAGYLQDALKEMSLRLDARSEEFVQFMDKVQQGQPVTTEDLIKYSHIFGESFALLPAAKQRPLLVSMCKFLGCKPIGTNAFLRWQTRMKLRRIWRDDLVIKNEGIKSLAFEELQQACTERGMIGIGLSKAALRKQMQDWLNLSLSADEEKLTLLLLSRALVEETREEVENGKTKEEEENTLAVVANAVSMVATDTFEHEREDLQKLKVGLKKIEAKTEKEYLIDKDKDGVITTEDISVAIELLRAKPSGQEVVDLLQKKLDLDQDGKVALADVRKVLMEALILKKAQERIEGATKTGQPTSEV